jgi:hypothetical protein
MREATEIEFFRVILSKLFNMIAAAVGKYAFAGSVRTQRLERYYNFRSR